MPGCEIELIGLLLLSLALLTSLCLNFIFCIRQRAILCRDTDESGNVEITEGESPSQDEWYYFHNLNHQQQLENPHNPHVQQAIPIYGNISTDRRGQTELCYEMMTMQHTRDRVKKSPESDLNYASLDLKKAKKHRKKNRHQPGRAQERNNLQDQLPARLTPPVNSFLAVEADTEAQLPSRDASTMVSHSSIYLNSQQIAQETEDMERERGWEGMRRQEECEGEQDGEGINDRTDYGNGSVCTQSEVEAVQSGADHFNSSFSGEQE